MSLGAPSAAHSRWSGSKNSRVMPTPTGGMQSSGGRGLAAAAARCHRDEYISPASRSRSVRQSGGCGRAPSEESAASQSIG
eukprot:scaffold262122_cov28-Tisochrysis_lutea.AAC.3